MSKVDIRNIPDEDPTNFEDTLPFVGSPNCATSRVINLGNIDFIMF